MSRESILLEFHYTNFLISVLWAQRSSDKDATKNIVYLTIRIPDSIHTKIELTSTGIKLDADSEDDSNHYALSLEFYDEIDAEASKRKSNGNSISFILRKKNLNAEYWPRLTKEKVKLHFLKTDFDKWRDEDEQDDEEESTENGYLPEGFGQEGQNIDLSSLQGLEEMVKMNQQNVTEEDFSSSDEEEEK